MCSVYQLSALVTVKFGQDIDVNVAKSVIVIIVYMYYSIEYTMSYYNHTVL